MKKKPKEVKTKAVAVKQEQAISTPDDMIKLGISKGSDLEKLEKLLVLKRQFDADNARKAYCSNMVLVHKNIPTVKKSLKNVQTHSSYAGLDEIIRETKKIYTDYGFSISFYEGKAEKPEDIRIYADVIQSLGHKETYHYDVPMDGKGIKGNVNMTPIHAKASSATYGQRKLMCMIWNIPTGDDNDGNTIESNKSGLNMPKTREGAAGQRVSDAEFNDSPPNPDDADQNQKSHTGDSEQSGVISKNSAISLKNLAKTNGYTNEEVYEIIGLLQYKKMVDILRQDYDTLIKGFKTKAKEWRKNKKLIESEFAK